MRFERIYVAEILNPKYQFILLCLDRMVYLIQAKKYERAAKRKLLKYHGIHIALKKIDKCLVGCTLTLNMVGTNDVINKWGNWKK